MSCSQSFPCSFTFFLSFYSEIHSIKKHVNIYWIMNTVQLCQYGVPTLFQHFELLYWTITNTYFFMLYLTWHFLIHFSYHCFSCLWQRIELCHIPQLNHSNSKRFQQKPNYLNLFQLMNSVMILVLPDRYLSFTAVLLGLYYRGSGLWMCSHSLSLSLGGWWEWGHVNPGVYSVVLKVRFAVLSLYMLDLNWRIIPLASTPCWPWPHSPRYNHTFSTVYCWLLTP